MLTRLEEGLMTLVPGGRSDDLVPGGGESGGFSYLDSHSQYEGEARQSWNLTGWHWDSASCGWEGRQPRPPWGRAGCAGSGWSPGPSGRPPRCPSHSRSRSRCCSTLRGQKFKYLRKFKLNRTAPMSSLDFELRQSYHQSTSRYFWRKVDILIMKFSNWVLLYLTDLWV